MLQLFSHLLVFSLLDGSIQPEALEIVEVHPVLLIREYIVVENPLHLVLYLLSVL
jgi:hypothetical protein